MHDEGHGCLRMIGWKDNQLEEWKEKDFEILMNSEALFARKFSIRHIEVVDGIVAFCPCASHDINPYRDEFLRNECISSFFRRHIS